MPVPEVVAALVVVAASALTDFRCLDPTIVVSQVETVQTVREPVLVAQAARVAAAVLGRLVLPVVMAERSTLLPAGLLMSSVQLY
jgi:hypothetical protein